MRLKGTCAGEAERGALLDGGEQQCAVEADIVRLKLAVERLEEWVLAGTCTNEKWVHRMQKNMQHLAFPRGPPPQYYPDLILLNCAVRMGSGDPG